MLIRLVERYLEMSSQVSFPALIIGIIAVFHLLGKQAILKHPLYKAVVNLGSKLKARRRMSLIMPSSPGAFVFSIPFMVSRISSVVNGVSSSVVIGSLISALSNLWWSLSDSSLLAGVKDSYHVTCRFSQVLCNCSIWLS